MSDVANKAEQPPKSNVRDDILAKALKYLRIGAVSFVGIVSTVCAAWGTVLMLRVNMARGDGLDSLTPTLIGCILLGGIFVWLLCLATYHLFSHWRSTVLPKAIRLNDAMELIHAGTHKERFNAIKYYSLRIFKAKIELPKGCSDNVKCKEISTFMSPMFFNIDRLNAIGSAHYCCDYAQLQKIINDNSSKWGTGEAKPNGSAGEIIALKGAVTELQGKNKDALQKYTAASGREAQLKKQMEEVERHMAVLIELANKVTNEFKPPQKITRDEVKAKYVAIGKIRGITEAPGKYVELFREVMPENIINQGGAPSQGSNNKKT